MIKYQLLIDKLVERSMALERMANHLVEDIVRKDYDKAYSALYEAIKELEDQQEMAKIERDPDKNIVIYHQQSIGTRLYFDPQTCLWTRFDFVGEHKQGVEVYINGKWERLEPQQAQ